MELKQRYDILNYLIERWGYKNYLEIGVADGQCYREIECDNKTWVDPSPLKEIKGGTGIYMPSDEAFVAFQDEGKEFDIIFIDGDHRYQQVLKDIDSSLTALAPGGTIVMHDCNPQSERAQLPRPTYGDWNGDVWKAFVEKRGELRHTHIMSTINTDQGLGIIRRLKDFSLVSSIVTFKKEKAEKLSYEFLTKHRWEALHLLSVENFVDWDGAIYDMVMEPKESSFEQ